MVEQRQHEGLPVVSLSWLPKPAAIASVRRFTSRQGRCITDIEGRASCPPEAEEDVMPKYLIERDIPGAGKSSRDDLKGISRTSCDVLAGMGPSIQWQQSYVTGDKVYCVYIADNEQLVRDHAQRAGIPANRVSEILAVIDPATAE
jgi:hypothetical protein